MLTIGLDMRASERGFKAHYGRGTGRYANELARSLRNYPDNSALAIRELGSSDLSGSALESKILKLLPLGKMTAETQLILPRSVSRLDVDYMHYLAHGDAPASGGSRYFVSVLDLIPLRFPELYRADHPNWRFRLARYLELRAIRGAAGIFAISDCTKRDIVELLDVEPEKIFVTPLAVSEHFSPASDAEVNALRDRLGLPSGKETLLYLGGIDPRKNVLFLLEVFQQLLAQLPEQQRPVLALAGGIEKDQCYPALKQKIAQLSLEDSVHLLGFVPDADLPALYRSAAIFVFPSLYEGFGFPVLEAMACGVPVVAGNNSSLPEVSGGALTLLPDSDQDAWFNGIKTLLESPKLRAELAARGLASANRFSWAETARKTLEGYQYFAASDGKHASLDVRPREKVNATR